MVAVTWRVMVGNTINRGITPYRGVGGDQGWYSLRKWYGDVSSAPPLYGQFYM